MRAVRTRDTAPELALAAALRRHGLRFRRHYGLVGTPDIAFPRRRVAIFVHGDYWHGNSWRARGFASLEDQFARWRNGAWWLRKVSANVRRDERQRRQLRRAGWRALRIWESDIERDVERCARRVLRAVRG
jgi:DNA mismatch endonuclease, patch repair protein